MPKNGRLILADPAPTIEGREMPCLFESAWRTDQFVRYFNAQVRDAETRRDLAEGVVWLCTNADRDGIDLRDMLPSVLSIYLEKMSCAGEPIAKIRAYWRSIRLFFDWMHGLELVSVNASADLPDPIHGFGLPERLANDAGDNGVVEIAVRLVERSQW